MPFAFNGVGGRWDWVRDDAGRGVALSEIAQAAQHIAATEGAVASSDFRALIRRKLRRAEKGLLREPQDGRPSLAIVPGVLEIKWRIEGTEWRLYFSEPLDLYAQRVMLGLHFNQKDSVAQQNEHILEAGRRWTGWRAQA